MVKTCNYHLQALRHVRQSIIRDVANIMACAIIGSRLDYCNEISHGMSGKNFDGLQSVQNRESTTAMCCAATPQPALDNFKSNEGQVDGSGSLVPAEDAKDSMDGEEK